MIHRARALNSPSRADIGFLNPRIHPLIGTANFFDVTGGSNGGYSATTAYDLVTGVGVPTVSTLLTTLLGPSITNPAGDGIPNLLKYALGLDPRSPEVSPVVVDTSTGYLRLTALRNQNATDVQYSVQVTTDLTNPASWMTTGTFPMQNTATQVRDTTPIGSVPERFIRLQINR